MTPEQLRMARALLDLNQDDVSAAVNIAKQTLVNAEKGRTNLKGENIAALQMFYEARGLEFLDHNGVREKPSGIRMLRGRSGFHEMYDQLFEEVRKRSGDIWLYNGTSSLVASALGEEYLATHRDRMEKYHGQANWRVVVKHGDDAFFGAKYAHYRWLPEQNFYPETIYVYGQTVALVDFKDDISITIIDKKGWADVMRFFLETIWNSQAYDPDSEKPFRPA